MTRRRLPDLLDIYARVSRVGDDRQRSTEGQVADSTARILALGAQVGEVHVDSGRSAWNPRVRRHGWDRLMLRLEGGDTGGVIVFDLARFSRRPIEGERLITAAERGLLILDSEDEYDLTTANGKKAFRDQMNSAAYESDRLSTRVKRGKRLAALRGEAPVAVRPFGFEADGMTIREDEAAVIRELTARLLAGESQESMIRDLDERGIRTSKGRTWTQAGLRLVLARPRNAGLIEHVGEIVGRMDGTPIVQEDTWRRVVALYGSRRRGRPASEEYLCSGLLYCGRCGHTLTGRPRTVAKPYPDGAPRREYWCQVRATRGAGCGRITVDQRAVDSRVRALVVDILGDPRHAAAVEDAARATRNAKEQLQTELAECDQLIEYLDDRLSRREISRARYDRMVAPLEAQGAELRGRIEALGTEAASGRGALEDEVAASREEWERRWAGATPAERRTLIRRALRGRRIVVLPVDSNAARTFHEDRIVIE
ncbi:recombinase family protein [Dactylosporangium sp. NPDC000521]|uniref:recombinase family protein n=1 Tax=Dactylosporangium sp. NPDC000521 TaxID=3363975 RepID=UPI0036B0C92B